MMLADKLILLRKMSGWSQEELAQRLGVTRQSVSKWEGAQSLPDLDKIVQMSRLFSVSTDYLLKDELEQPEQAKTAPARESVPAARRVGMQEAQAFLALRKKAAPKMAIATFLCVISPVALIYLSGCAAMRGYESAAAGAGVSVLLILVAAAVALFLNCGAQNREFAFLQEEQIELDPDARNMVIERRRASASNSGRMNIAGTLLCILSALPLFFAMASDGTDFGYIVAVCLLLVMAGFGAAVFVYAGTINGAMQQLLEDGDYTRARKAKSRTRGAIAVCYWLVVTAVFLYYTFGPNGNGQPQYSWVIWAIGGVLFGALMAVLKLVGREKD